MGKRAEQTFFRRGNADGLQVHEKILNITSQGNANQNRKEKSSHTCQNDYHQKERKEQTLVRLRGKVNPHTWLVGMHISAASMENIRRFLKKLKTELLHDPAIPLLATYSKEMKHQFEMTHRCQDLQWHYLQLPRYGSNISFRKQLHG